MNDRKYEYKEPKESLHWINFSMKKLMEAQVETNRLLADISKKLCSSPNTPKSDPSEDLPF